MGQCADSRREDSRSTGGQAWIGGSVIAAGMFWLAIRSKTSVSVLEFLLVLTLMWVTLVYTFIRSAQFTTSAKCLWTLAVVSRIAGLFANPIFEDDWYRYLWDGRVFVTEGNPYDRAPAAYFSQDVSQPFNQILDNINYPEVPTIYGPVCQYVFAAAYLLAPGKLWPLKLALLLADLMVIWCLLRLTTTRNTLLYAWCPLALHEISMNAHPEILGVAPAMLTLLLLRRDGGPSAVMALAVACAARIHAILLAPFFLVRVQRRCWPVLPLSIGALYLPFWLQGSPGDWAGLRAFLGEWEFNSTVYAVLANAFGVSAAKTISPLAFAVAYGLLLTRDRKRNRHSIPRGDWLYGLFFLFSAIANPWYLLWLVPFVAIFPSVTGITACAVVSLSYVHGLNLDVPGLAPYHHPGWVRPVEIGAVACAFVIDGLRLRTKRETC